VKRPRHCAVVLDLAHAGGAAEVGHGGGVCGGLWRIVEASIDSGLRRASDRKGCRCDMKLDTWLGGDSGFTYDTRYTGNLEANQRINELPILEQNW
jgi:hypothetical protein